MGINQLQISEETFSTENLFSGIYHVAEFLPRYLDKNLLTKISLKDPSKSVPQAHIWNLQSFGSKWPPFNRSTVEPRYIGQAPGWMMWPLYTSGRFRQIAIILTI